jgi:hypothetical protein
MRGVDGVEWPDVAEVEDAGDDIGIGTRIDVEPDFLGIAEVRRELFAPAATGMQYPFNQAAPFQTPIATSAFMISITAAFRSVVTSAELAVPTREVA